MMLADKNVSSPSNKQEKKDFLSMNELVKFALNPNNRSDINVNKLNNAEKTFRNRLKFLYLKPYAQCSSVYLRNLSTNAAELSKFLEENHYRCNLSTANSSDQSDKIDALLSNHKTLASITILPGKQVKIIKNPDTPMEQFRKLLSIFYDKLDTIFPSQSPINPFSGRIKIPQQCKGLLAVILNSDCCDGRQDKDSLETRAKLNQQLLTNIQVYLSDEEKDIISSYPIYTNAQLEVKLSVLIASYIKSIYNGFDSAAPALRYQEMYSFLRCLQSFYLEQKSIHILKHASQSPTVFPADAKHKSNGQSALEQAITLEDLVTALLIMKLEGTSISKYQPPVQDSQLVAPARTICADSAKAYNQLVERVKQKQLPELCSFDQAKSTIDASMPNLVRFSIDDTAMSPRTYQEVLYRLNNVFSPQEDPMSLDGERLSLYFQQLVTAYYESHLINEAAYKMSMDTVSDIFSPYGLVPIVPQNLFDYFNKFLVTWRKIFDWTEKETAILNCKMDELLAPLDHSGGISKKQLHDAFYQFSEISCSILGIDSKTTTAVLSYIEYIFSEHKDPLPISAGNLYMHYKDLAAAYFHATDIFYTTPHEMSAYIEAELCSRKHKLLDQLK